MIDYGRPTKDTIKVIVDSIYDYLHIVGEGSKKELIKIIEKDLDHYFKINKK